MPIAGAVGAAVSGGCRCRGADLGAMGHHGQGMDTLCEWADMHLCVQRSYPFAFVCKNLVLLHKNRVLSIMCERAWVGSLAGRDYIAASKNVHWLIPDEQHFMGKQAC